MGGGGGEEDVRFSVPQFCFFKVSYLLTTESSPLGLALVCLQEEFSYMHVMYGPEGPRTLGRTKLTSFPRNQTLSALLYM